MFARRRDIADRVLPRISGRASCWLALVKLGYEISGASVRPWLVAASVLSGETTACVMPRRDTGEQS
jgi:hypothetical protein